MKAAVYYGKKDIRVEEWEDRPLQADEVKVKVAWTGICGSDLHEYVDGPLNTPAEPNKYTHRQLPFPLGHEFSGIVEDIGADVTHVAKGDRVVINPSLTPDNQPEGFDNTEGIGFLGLIRPGAFAQYVNAPETVVHKVPDNLPLKYAALVEPQAVANQAIKEARLAFGQTVAVIGVGPIGIATILGAKSAGAKRIVAIDLSYERLSLAKDMGADAVYNSNNFDTQQILDSEGFDKGFDVTFEVAGVAPTFVQAIELTKARGQVSILSIFAHEIEWNPAQLTKSFVNVQASLGYTYDTFLDTLELIANGRIDASKMITSEIPLDEVPDGFELLANDKKQAKILVNVDGEDN